MNAEEVTTLARKFWLRATEASQFREEGAIQAARAKLDDCNEIYRLLFYEFSVNPGAFGQDVIELLQQGRANGGRAQPLSLESKIEQFLAAARRRRTRHTGRAEPENDERSACCHRCKKYLNSNYIWECSRCRWMKCPECRACGCTSQKR